MGQFLTFLRRVDLMRMALGICMVVDGYPIIFFLKETLKLAPGSTVFTAVFMLLGFVLMIPFSVLRRLYRPNFTLFWYCIAFLILTTLYMFFYTTVGYSGLATDLIYYAYILIFLFLLINIPNDILEEIIPIIILFTFISNVVLVYSLIKDPYWAVGQRASITFGGESADERSGNPHVFAKNAVVGIIASLVWAMRTKTGLIMRLLCVLSLLVNLAVITLTMARTSVLALVLMGIAFLFFNVGPSQIRSLGRTLVRPSTLIIAFLLFFGTSFAIQRNAQVYGILYGYVVAFADRNLENVYALLGMKVNNQTVRLDDSAANRTTSARFLSNVLNGHLETLVVGAGYKATYLDVPVVEALINHGFLGLILFGGFNLLLLYHSFNAMRLNPHPFSIFLAYFYLYFLVAIFTGGRPYDTSIWHPFALMIRFLGVERYLPARLLSPNV